MKTLNLRKERKQTLQTILVFVAMLVIIALAYPHKSGAFAYHVEEGRPWAYGLITAPYDFPIYKTEEKVMAEQREAISHFAPYFNINERVASEQQKAAKTEAKEVLSLTERGYLNKKLEQIYSKGILSIADLEIVLSENHQQITVVDAKHKAKTVSLDECFTPRTAYESIMLDSPEGEKAKLQKLPLNKWLVPNLAYDSATTADMMDKLLNEVTTTCGIVQKGEKIIDQGEIVDAQTYLILTSLKRTMEEKGIDSDRARWMRAGVIFILALFVFLLATYLYVFRPQLFSDLRAILFFCQLTTVIVLAACVVTRYTSLSIYIVPFAWVPIIIRVFYDSRTALFVHLITVLLCAFLAPVPFEFIVLQIAAGMVAVSSLRDMSQRSQLIQTAAWILLTYALCYTAFILSQKGSIDMLHWHIYMYFLANAVLTVCSYILIYLFEKMFRLVSSVTLVELTNINSELMLEFAEKAPGSFQHSLQVSNLAMEAAKRVGANALLVRTGALYHDIGKMKAPQNFTENQQGGCNPLNALSFEKAAGVVIQHVADGVSIAEANNLPEVIVSFIRMHHGTSKTRYFYNSFANANPGQPIDDKLFEYPGPKPNSMETAILMMADAVEARSRTLTEYSEEAIRKMVDQMIDMQMDDEQFVETPLTFKDIQIIKDVFAKKLISMNHHRIVYPELHFDGHK